MEVVAGEAENDERVWMSLVDGGIQLFQTLELTREATIRGGVDHQDHFAS